MYKLDYLISILSHKERTRKANDYAGDKEKNLNGPLRSILKGAVIL